MYGLYRSWKDSGKTRAGFAKENGLVPATFYYWAKKFSRTGKEEAGPLAGFRQIEVAPPPGMVPLRGSVTLPGLPWSFSGARIPS